MLVSSLSGLLPPNRVQTLCSCCGARNFVMNRDTDIVQAAGKKARTGVGPGCSPFGHSGYYTLVITNTQIRYGYLEVWAAQAGECPVTLSGDGTVLPEPGESVAHWKERTARLQESRSRLILYTNLYLQCSHHQGTDKPNAKRALSDPFCDTNKQNP